MDAARPALREGKLIGFRSAQQLGLRADKGELFADKHLVGTEFATAFLQLGFVVEEIEVRGGADEVDIDDVFRLCWMMEAGIRLVLGEKRMERCAADSEARALEQFSASKHLLIEHGVTLAG